MKKVFIIHGWDFNPKMNWYPWLKRELEDLGFDVKVPSMPKTESPEINTWVDKLSDLVKIPDANTYFVGHSIGCQTILRYLESINKKVGGAVFVAGWLNLTNLEGKEVENIVRPWLETKIYFNKVKKVLPKLSVILSDNDPYNCLEENSKIFKEKLSANVIIEKNKGHFTESDGVKKLPIVLKELLRLLR